jgi:hypothetical protein
MIAEEIERKTGEKVIEIRLVQLISLCVCYKVQYTSDWLYKPFDNMGQLNSLSFTDKTAEFYRGIHNFECVQNLNKRKRNDTKKDTLEG